MGPRNGLTATEILFSVFMLALQSVQRNMLRSFLTILSLAVGVPEHEVLPQILLEPVVLSNLGGVIGILIATAASRVLSNVMGMGNAFDPFLMIRSPACLA